MTPLLIACEKGQTLAVKALVKSGANLKAKTISRAGELTALHLAVHSGKIELVGFLVQSGAELDATDNQGRTPLEMSTQANIGRSQKDLINSFLLSHLGTNVCKGEGCVHCQNELDDLCDKMPDLLDE